MYKWDSITGKFIINYKPHYDNWLKLLKRVVPEMCTISRYTVTPIKIVAQYETKNTYFPQLFTSYRKKVTIL